MGREREAKRVTSGAPERERERERERRGVPNKNEERRSDLTDSWERYHDITAAPASLRRSRVAHTHPPGEDRNNPNISPLLGKKKKKKERTSVEWRWQQHRRGTWTTRTKDHLLICFTSTP